MKELLQKQKTLTIAQELSLIASVPAYSQGQHIFIKYGIDKFDVSKIQQLVNIMGIELAERVISQEANDK